MRVIYVLGPDHRQMGHYIRFDLGMPPRAAREVTTAERLRGYRFVQGDEVHVLPGFYGRSDAEEIIGLIGHMEMSSVHQLKWVDLDVPPDPMPNPSDRAAVEQWLDEERPPHRR